MEQQKPTIFPAYDAMVLPILCVLALFVINRTGIITRNEAYVTGVCLVLLYLPFTRHSLEVAQEGLCLRHSILPRRRRFAWSDLAAIRYSLRATGERARLTLCPRVGRRRHITLNLQKEETAVRFRAFLEQARLHLGAEKVAEIND